MRLCLPVKRLTTPRKIYNVDGTLNKKGDILFYTALEVQIGEKHINMKFFLMDLGPQQMILGYPWFAAMQPKIDWAWEWIDYTQLPVVIRAPNSHQAAFVLKMMRDKGGREQSLLVKKGTKVPTPPVAPPKKVVKITLPQRYRQHAQVFSKQSAQHFPQSRLWDHVIGLKKDAPNTLPGKVYSLTQSKQVALQEFVKEHSQKGYIRLSKSPYAAPFFFIKKKDGKL